MFHRTRMEGSSADIHNYALETPAKPKSIIKEGSAAWRSLQAVTGLGVLALGIVASPFIGIAKTGHFLKDQYRIHFKPNSILAATRTMKGREEASKLKTMQDIKTNCDPLINEALSSDYKVKFSADNFQEKTKLNIYKRLIIRELTKNGTLTPELLTEIKNHQSITRSAGYKFSMGEESDALNKALSEINENRFIAICLEVDSRTEKLTEAEIDKFQKSIGLLAKTLENPNSQNPANVNKKFLKDLRKALNSPVYQALKDDTTDPSVKLLHKFACALWNKAPSMDAFMDVGKAIHKKLPISVSAQVNEGEKADIDTPPHDDEVEVSESRDSTSLNAPVNAPPFTGKELAEKLRISQKIVAKEYWTDHGLFNKAMYAITHPRQAMGSMASTGGNLRIVPSLVGAQAYDSHANLSNNPSINGESTYKLKDKGIEYTATVNNCYGGSPTIDDEISPEFLAVLQAAENNQLADINDQDPDIPQMINYTNLQNISKKKGEGPRSLAIMQLNDKYPLSFFGMTLSKDSTFYKMPNEKDVVYENAQQFGLRMKGELMRSFDPAQSGHGYYFPGNQAKWSEVFDQVIENANRYFQDKDAFSMDSDPRKLQGAYQEYVYSMLNGIIEMESIKALKERGIETPKIMAIKACKENIDRGGMENIKYMYIKLSKKDQEDIASLLLGCMHGRPLSARDRVILEDRMPQVLAFMETIEPEVFKENMETLFHQLGYGLEESSFKPALTPPSP